jgi:hypothetical protein
MRWTRMAAQDERRTTRTAKSRGPGAPTLASSPRGSKRFPGATVARKPGHRGEREVSRKPPRREGRIASAEPVCSCAFSCCHLRTRPRVQRAPGLPCALLLFRGREIDAKLGRIAPRECEDVSAWLFDN